MLSRITEPTRARIELPGRIASLLKVGTGFHPERTGRENVYLHGTILGMRKREIDRKFGEIVEFSERPARRWPFREGISRVELYCHTGVDMQDVIDVCAALDSHDGDFSGTGMIPGARGDLALLEHEWSTRAD